MPSRYPSLGKNRLYWILYQGTDPCPFYRESMGVQLLNRWRIDPKRSFGQKQATLCEAHSDISWWRRNCWATQWPKSTATFLRSAHVLFLMNHANFAAQSIKYLNTIWNETLASLGRINIPRKLIIFIWWFRPCSVKRSQAGRNCSENAGWRSAYPRANWQLILKVSNLEIKEELKVP